MSTSALPFEHDEFCKLACLCSVTLVRGGFPLLAILHSEPTLTINPLIYKVWQPLFYIPLIVSAGDSADSLAVAKLMLQQKDLELGLQKKIGRTALYLSIRFFRTLENDAAAGRSRCTC
jgi:hypothetical protein